MLLFFLFLFWICIRWMDMYVLFVLSVNIITKSPNRCKSTRNISSFSFWSFLLSLVIFYSFGGISFFGGQIEMLTCSDESFAQTSNIQNHWCRWLNQICIEKKLHNTLFRVSLKFMNHLVCYKIECYYHSWLTPGRFSSYWKFLKFVAIVSAKNGFSGTHWILNENFVAKQNFIETHQNWLSLFFFFFWINFTFHPWCWAIFESILWHCSEDWCFKACRNCPIHTWINNNRSEVRVFHRKRQPRVKAASL